MNAKPLILASFFLLSAPVFAAKTQTTTEKKSEKTAEKAVVTVNGVPVPAIQAQIILAERKAAGGTVNSETEAAVRNQLAVRELQVQQAKSLNLASDPVLSARIRMATDELLAQAYRRQFIEKHPASDDAVNQAYAALKTRAGDREYHIRHILVESEEAALALIKRLQGKEKFADLANQSTDSATKSKGGDIGWVTPLKLQPHVVSAVTSMTKAGLVASPVKGPGGWHVVQVDEIRPYTMPALDQNLRQQLASELARQELEAHLLALLKDAKIQ